MGRAGLRRRKDEGERMKDEAKNRGDAARGAA
jgi:hypothetical protein